MSASKRKSREKSRKILKVYYANRVVGMVAHSLDDLLKKCQQKFKTTGKKISLTLEDGTEIDEEYFDVLDDNSPVKFCCDTSLSSEIISRLTEFLNEYVESNFNDIDGKLKDVLQITSLPDMLRALVMLNFNESNSAKSDFRDDPAWFQGLTTKYTCKETVLRNSAESRMRGYLYKLKKDLEEFAEQKNYQDMLGKLQAKLKSRSYNSFYFDRTSRERESLCDGAGRFSCHGDFLSPACPSLHALNPYASRESRILFSTWNFDHVIEKSRSIIPAVQKALKDSAECEIDADYLFELMFEHCSSNGRGDRGNLKLVHIVCHNKAPHNLDCDLTKLIKQPASNNKRIKIQKEL